MQHGQTVMAGFNRQPCVSMHVHGHPQHLPAVSMVMQVTDGQQALVAVGVGVASLVSALALGGAAAAVVVVVSGAVVTQGMAATAACA